MNANETPKPPCWRREVVVRRQEKKLTPHIICTDDILCCVKSSPCQLDVKASNDMYPTRMITPDMVVVLLVSERGKERPYLGKDTYSKVFPLLCIHADDWLTEGLRDWGTVGQRNWNLLDLTDSDIVLLFTLSFQLFTKTKSKSISKFYNNKKTIFSFLLIVLNREYLL